MPDGLSSLFEEVTKHVISLQGLLIAIASTITVMAKPWQFRTLLRERREQETRAAIIADRAERAADSARIEAAITAAVEPIYRSLKWQSGRIEKLDGTQDDIQTDTEKRLDISEQRIAAIEGQLERM